MRKSLSKKEEIKHIEHIETRRIYIRCKTCKSAQIRTIESNTKMIECDCGSWIDLEVGD